MERMSSAEHVESYWYKYKAELESDGYIAWPVNCLKVALDGGGIRSEQVLEESMECLEMSLKEREEVWEFAIELQRWRPLDKVEMLSQKEMLDEVVNLTHQYGVYVGEIVTRGEYVVDKKLDPRYFLEFRSTVDAYPPKTEVMIGFLLQYLEYDVVTEWLDEQDIGD